MSRASQSDNLIKGSCYYSIKWCDEGAEVCNVKEKVLRAEQRDEAHGMGERKQDLPTRFEESVRILGKLREGISMGKEMEKGIQRKITALLLVRGR